MTKKMNILVPTDFSPASRAGVRFAIQLSTQQNVHITFVHVLTLFRSSKWSDQEFEAFAVAERKKRRSKLDSLVAGVQRRFPAHSRNYSSLLLEGLGADLVLVEYCQRHPEIQLVCMGTRGASRINKLFGTNTGNFILHSDTPVIVVPSAYRRKEISSVLYVTDLTNCQVELKEIVALARPLHASVGVLHLGQPGEVNLNTGVLQKIWKKEFGYPVTVDCRPADSSRSMVADLDKSIGDCRPSLVAMFSNRRRTLFQTIFYPSRAELLSFRTKTPLLVLGKNKRRL